MISLACIEYSLFLRNQGIFYIKSALVQVQMYIKVASDMVVFPFIL